MLSWPCLKKPYAMEELHGMGKSRFGMQVMLVVALLLFCLALPCAAQPPKLTDEVITERDTGRSYTYKVGKKFRIEVPDPGDGHQFKDPQFDPKVLKLLGRKVTPHEKSKQMPGDVGQVVFTLEAVGAGKTELAVHFFNPKEKNQEPMEMLKVNVEVTK